MVFRRKGTGASVSYAEAVEEALCFGWIDGVKGKLDATRYTHRFTPRRPNSRWSAPNRQRAAALIAAGLMQPAGQAAIDAAKRAGTWDPPAAAPPPAEVSALPVTPPRPAEASARPAELDAALARAPAARRAYDALAPGQRRLWARWVGAAKQAETRARRAAATVAQLRAGHKIPRGA